MVRLEKIQPNRDTAWSSSVLAPYTAEPAYLRHEAERKQQVMTWNVDRVKGVAKGEGVVVTAGLEAMSPACPGQGKGGKGQRNSAHQEGYLKHSTSWPLPDTLDDIHITCAPVPRLIP